MTMLIKSKPTFYSLDDPLFVTHQDHRKELGYSDVYFSEENENYKNNILNILMKIVGEEIRRLPATQRDVIIRFFIYSESDAIIAKNLGRNKRSILDRRQRAIVSLRKRLAENPYVYDLLDKFKHNLLPGNYEELTSFFNELL